MKIISWNVNGLKSIIEKGFLEEIIAQDPDILCLQEVKSTEIPEIENYISYNYHASELVNFYGTAIYTKVEPLSVRKGFGDKEFDAEGRVIRMEFENFYLYNVYCPSGASSQERLGRKFRFYDEFTEYVYKSNKPSIICGDFNRISAEIDAKNPKNIKGKSGFLPEEQEWFKEILTKYVDAFRKFHDDGDNFTWWPNRKGFREENKGYRFDYFLVSNTFENTLTESYILKDQMGSDHAPIVLELNSCPVCGTVNNNDNEFCYQCGIKLIETEEEEEVREDKLEIPKDKIILLDLNYTLIANSKEIRTMPLDKKIKSQKYETDLINLIKDNYVILITASPYRRSYKILRDIKEKTGFEPNESFWNFGRQPPALKKYWMENEVIPQHGDGEDKYLAIESNPATRRMYKKLGIEARPKGDFI
ncbi:exodeoxyribonuclease III [Methanobrevibacter smithii]|uniref:exodeoxyribonuclease III n=1 Tax=Methanobrevibacter smithii TaxID=2173 RepID=UPI00307EDF85